MKRGYIELGKRRHPHGLTNQRRPCHHVIPSQFGKAPPMTSAASYGSWSIVRSFSSHPSPQHRRISLQRRDSSILSVGWPSHHRWGGWVTLPFKNVQSDLDHLSSEHLLAHHAMNFGVNLGTSNWNKLPHGQFSYYSIPSPMHWTFSPTNHYRGHNTSWQVQTVGCHCKLGKLQPASERPANIRCLCLAHASLH